MPQTTPSATQSHWMRNLLIGFALLMIFLAAAGILYQSVASTFDRRAHPMPGELIDVGGYKMHVDCTGQGAPAVILESGLGDSFFSWQKVQPKIAQFTRVCSYDRAGIGYSEPSPRPRTSKVFAEE